jgi:hypothetical protein
MRAPGIGILPRVCVPKLFTAAACLGRAQVVLPGGDSAADLTSATLLKLLEPLDTSVT